LLYAPRTIAFLSELFHPPGPTDAAAIQRVHNELFETGAPLYKSYSVTPQGAVLSNPVAGPGAVSTVAFLPDRFQFREELSGLTVEDFAARVTELAGRVVRRTQAQVFTAQTVTIRTLVNPRHFDDSREFMRQGLFGFDDETAVFERDPSLLGIRLVFTPEPETPNQHALRIESFASDKRSLFVENQAGFAPILVARGLDPIAANIQATYDFIVERALGFASRFDGVREG